MTTVPGWTDGKQPGMLWSGDEAVCAALGTILAQDLEINRLASAPTVFELELLATAVDEIARRKRIVFTAFDGDHQHLCPHMRRFALSLGAVPANAESILGYRDVVTARGDKRSVLLDDLSLLRHCDELWVYTDVPASLAGIRQLAEGVLVELLFFLRTARRPVYFVQIGALLRGQQCRPEPFPFAYEDSVRALESSQLRGVLEIVESAGEPTSPFFPVAYHIVDPLDFKFANWLRPVAYGHGHLPLVPGLAIEIADVEPGDLGSIVVGWAALMRIAQVVWVFKPTNQKRPSPAVCELLVQISKRKSKIIQTERHWTEYSIPKVHAPTRWPLTEKEGHVGCS
jgi:hypothetical protein